MKLGGVGSWGMIVSSIPVSAFINVYGVGSNGAWSHLTKVLVPSVDLLKVSADVSKTELKSILLISSTEKIIKFLDSYIVFLSI